MAEYTKMSVVDLLNRIDDSVGTDDAVQSISVLRIKLAVDANNLSALLLDSNKATRDVAEKQLAASEKANRLAEELLLSNRQSSIQGEKNAKLMNDATEQLAKSTGSLKWAT
jgi:hypothetical protein